MKICLRPGYLWNRFEIEIWVQNFYWGTPLEPTSGGEWKKQEWVQGTVELWCPNKGLRQPHRELGWSFRVILNWGKESEHLYLAWNVLQIRAVSKEEPSHLDHWTLLRAISRISWEALLANTPSCHGRRPSALRETWGTHDSNDDKLFTRNCGVGTANSWPVNLNYIICSARWQNFQR